MITLHETKNTEVNFILAPENYTGLYNKLEQHLPKELMQFFAKPVKSGTRTKWYIEDNVKYNKNDIKSYDSLDEQQKNMVSDYIEHIKPQIENILSRNRYFEQNSYAFFVIPETKNIKVILTEFEPIIILTQWACKSNSIVTTVDKLKAVINRPKPNREKIIVLVKYTDKSIALNRQFYFEYTGFQTVQLKSKTNTKGMRDMGKFKYDSQFSVYDIIENQKRFIHNFTVKKGQEIYEVVFPIFANAKVKVINQKKQIVPNIDVIINYDNEDSFRNTAKTGFFSLENLEVGKEVIISEKAKPENKKKYIVEKNNNEFVLEILQDIFSDLIIKVVNQKGEIVPNTLLLLEYEGKHIERTEKEHQADDQAEINLEEILIGSKIKATEKNNSSNIQEYTFSEDQNELIFKITQPFYKNVKIKVLNQHNELVPDTTLLLTYKGENIELGEKEHTANELAFIDLNNILEGSQIKAIEKDEPKNIQTYIVTEQEDELIFTIFVPEPKFVKIKLEERPIFLLFWKKEKPLVGITIDFTYNGETRQAITDKDGICTLPEGSFVNNEKVKTVIHIPKKTKKDKEKKEDKKDKQNEPKK